MLFWERSSFPQGVSNPHLFLVLVLKPTSFCFVISPILCPDLVNLNKTSPTWIHEKIHEHLKYSNMYNFLVFNIRLILDFKPPPYFYPKVFIDTFLFQAVKSTVPILHTISRLYTTFLLQPKTPPKSTKYTHPLLFRFRVFICGLFVLYVSLVCFSFKKIEILEVNKYKLN